MHFAQVAVAGLAFSSENDLIESLKCFNE